MPSTDNPIATAQREQREAAARYIADGHPLAELGMGDQFAEEFLLTQGQESNAPSTMTMKLTNGHSAVIDLADFLVVSAYRWYGVVDGKTAYAYAHITTSSGKKTTIKMHRLLCPQHPVVDHINGNGLDNRRVNLRDGSHGVNAINRAPTGLYGLKGVHHEKRTGKWDAKITKGGKTFCLGTYLTKEEAAKAYDIAAVSLYGSAARLNFPQEAQP